MWTDGFNSLTRGLVCDHVGQVGAISLGISRALEAWNPTYRTLLARGKAIKSDAVRARASSSSSSSSSSDISSSE